MKSLIVYDSVHGNTEKIARAIGSAIGEATVVSASEAKVGYLSGVDLLIVGSPTHGGRATEAMQGFLRSLTSAEVKGLRVAAFDTRLPSRFVKLFGYAADRIASNLTDKGANVVSAPEGFIVLATKGPLKDGEEKRAADWAKRLLLQSSR